MDFSLPVIGVFLVVYALDDPAAQADSLAMNKLSKFVPLSSPRCSGS